jgi:hypothetical protein
MPLYKSDISENSFQYIITPTGGTYFPPEQSWINGQDITTILIVPIWQP